MKFIRSIISSVVEGVIKRISGSGRSFETITDREYFQHYGFTSRPLAGAEGIFIVQGNNLIAIASDDRRYRIAIEDGELALYTDEDKDSSGHRIHFKRNREIEITGQKISINSDGNVEINVSGSAKIFSNDVQLGVAGGAAAARAGDATTVNGEHPHSHTIAAGSGKVKIG